MAPIYDAGIKIYPVPGNHENVGMPDAWRAAFPELPRNGPADPADLSYSVVHNNALFVAADEYVTGHQVDQAWVDGLLTDPNRPAHVFVFGHEPAFQAYHTTTLAMHADLRDAFWNSLGAAGAPMYLCGHDHLYARAGILDANGHEVQQLIVGTGGAPFYTFQAYADPRVQPIFHDFDHYGYLLVEVDGSTVNVQYKAQLDPAKPLEFTTIDQVTYPAAAPATQP